MINRQRFGIFLMSSALVGGFLLPAAAAEFTPAPGAAAPASVAAPPAPVVAAPAQVSAPAPKPVAAAPAPAKTVRTSHATHKIVARMATPVNEPVRETTFEVASTTPTGSPCRLCGYPMIFGIAY
jgi:hypothetical protein